jgi:hypothetical protein
MTVENTDIDFLKENVDLRYLKKTIDMGLVSSLLDELRPAPAPEPSPGPTTQGAEESEPEPAMEEKEEKSILQRIKGLWKRTDRKITEVDTNIKNLESAHFKLKEIQQLKHQYDALLAEKLGKIVK